MVKTNLCRYPKALGVRFEEGESGHELHELGEGEGRPSHELHELGEGGKAGGTVPRVVYGDAPKAFKEPTQAEVCAAWLVEVLEEAGEPMRPKEVVALEKEEGVIYRARKELEGRVVNTEGKRAPGNRWEYAG